MPFDWKKDFDDEYLKNIRFICLCLSESYIDNHFDNVKRYASCIESRLDDGYCTADLLKRDNRFYLDGCREDNLNVVLIDNDYYEEVNRILE